MDMFLKGKMCKILVENVEAASKTGAPHTLL